MPVSVPTRVARGLGEILLEFYCVKQHFIHNPSSLTIRGAAPFCAAREERKQNQPQVSAGVFLVFYFLIWEPTCRSWRFKFINQDCTKCEEKILVYHAVLSSLIQVQAALIISPHPRTGRIVPLPFLALCLHLLGWRQSRNPWCAPAGFYRCCTQVKKRSPQFPPILAELFTPRWVMSGRSEKISIL